MQAAIAEERGDLRGALDLARKAFALERAALERGTARSMRNARAVAETDLLEREADLERERRRRVERELAEAVVRLGDHGRVAETVERKLRDALSGADAGHGHSIARAMREMLAELRAEPARPDLRPRYLGGVDEGFYNRLRDLYPGLTPKQERLCGLLRAGLSSKDIATILHLGAEGLKAQRKRLRRKLNLAADERLETVLAEIL
jgi:DNA-binding CsgD family transcriptional regulator